MIYIHMYNRVLFWTYVCVRVSVFPADFWSFYDSRIFILNLRKCVEGKRICVYSLA
jgi:hypothetical protein